MRTAILIVSCAILAACGGEAVDPEEELRQWVTTMELAAEEKDRSGMLDGISNNYADGRGNTRKDIGDRLLIVFLRQQPVAIVSTIDEISVIGGSAAKLNLTVAMAGTNSGVFGLSADAYKFALELEKEDDDWMLIGARWAELGQDLH